MTQRVIESFGGLAGQGASRGVGNGAGDHQRQRNAQRLKLALDSKNGGLGVQRVENSFDHDDVRAAFNQCARRFPIGGDQLIKSDITKGGIVDVRRDGTGTVGWPQHACDIARTVRRFCAPFIGAGAGELCRFVVNLRRQRLHMVVRHGDGGGVEGVSFQNIGARLKISVMYGADNIGLR